MTEAALTKAWVDGIIASIAMPVSRPGYIMVSPYVRSVFVVSQTAEAEAWNWRRTKRELRRISLKRKGVRRPYHKRALDG